LRRPKLSTRKFSQRLEEEEYLVRGAIHVKILHGKSKNKETTT
jgi:hypothetical protein